MGLSCKTLNFTENQPVLRHIPSGYLNKRDLGHDRPGMGSPTPASRRATPRGQHVADSRCGRWPPVAAGRERDAVDRLEPLAATGGSDLLL